MVLAVVGREIYAARMVGSGTQAAAYGQYQNCRKQQHHQRLRAREWRRLPFLYKGAVILLKTKYSNTVATSMARGASISCHAVILAKASAGEVRIYSRGVLSRGKPQ